MPYQPTHPHPYLEPIDVTNPIGNIFSVIVNPKDVIRKYNLSVISDTSNSVVYTTGAVTLSQDLFGSEEGTSLTVSIPSSSDMINGKNYRWKIVLYSPTGESIESPLYYFSTKKNPVITFMVPNTISSCEYTFTATYSQQQNEKYMYYKYTLYRDDIIIDETPEKMDSKLSYTYNGLIADNSYRIDLTVVTNDKISYTVSRSFDVEYDTQSSPVSPIAAMVYDKNCINVDYSQNIFVKGNTDATVTYSDFQNCETSSGVTCVSIPSNKSIYYNKINEYSPLQIGDDFTLYYSVHFTDFFVGNILRLTDEKTDRVYNVRYDGRKFFYKIGLEPEVAIDPYADSENTHKERSAIHSSGTTLSSLNYDTLYMLYGNDVLHSDDVFMYNDITANFWWNIVLLPDKAFIYRGERYSESVVI